MSSLSQPSGAPVNAVAVALQTQRALSKASQPASPTNDLTGHGVRGSAVVQGTSALSGHYEVRLEGEDIDSDSLKGVERVARLLGLRTRYHRPVDAAPVTSEAVDGNGAIAVEMVDGIFRVFLPTAAADTSAAITDSDGGGPSDMADKVVVDAATANIVPWAAYVADLRALFDALEVGPWLSLCRTRLIVLEEKFELFSLLNAGAEDVTYAQCGGARARVDLATRLGTSVTAGPLVEFVRAALRGRPQFDLTLPARQMSAANRDLIPTSTLTFQEYSRSLGVPTSGDGPLVTVEGLGLHPMATKTTRLRRYDAQDPTLNVSGAAAARLLQVLLSPTGPASGRPLAALVLPHLARREPRAAAPSPATSTAAATTASAASAAAAAATARRAHAVRRRTVTATEVKVPVCGRRADEWARTAQWLCENDFVSLRHTLFVAEISRVSRHRAEYQCVTNEDQLRHFFEPLFMATLFPDDPAYAAIAVALTRFGAICVESDELTRTVNFSNDAPRPAKMPWAVESLDDYQFLYFVHANLTVLNALRRQRGQNTLALRVVCGESATHWDQLVASYLLADSIEQGTRLSESWVLQYLYYMWQIGIAVSPLASNGAGVPYADCPFPRLYKRGLAVSLATADPLHHHHHPLDPLTEEYATAQRFVQLSAGDMAEVAHTSVLRSAFSRAQKAAWIGAGFDLGVGGNDPSLSGVSDLRLRFRHDAQLAEQDLLNAALTGLKKDPALQLALFRRVPRWGGGLVGGAAAAAVGKTDVPRGVPAPLAASALVPSLAVGAVGATLGPNVVLERRLEELSRRDGRVKFARILFDCPAPDAALRPHVMLVQRALELRATYRLRSVAREIAEDYNIETQRTSASLLRGTSASYTDTKGHNYSHSEDADGVAARHVASSAAPATSAAVEVDEEHELEAAFAARRSDDSFNPDLWSYEMCYGVCLPHRYGTAPQWPSAIPSFGRFIADVEWLSRVDTERPALRALADTRLRLLERKFNLHLALNVAREGGELRDKELNNRDFYTAHKVDNNVLAEYAMNPRVLFDFFVEKALNSSSDVVFVRDEVPVTLGVLLEELGLHDVQRRSVDEIIGLLQADRLLRETFLSIDNYMGGRYFAEVLKRTTETYTADRFTFAETRIPLCGRSAAEWPAIAAWCDRYGMVSPHTRWVVRVPRDYAQLHRDGAVKSFAEFLDNIFLPLWAVSLHPARHPKFHYLLAHISGLDCDGVEDEVNGSGDATLRAILPHQWTSAENPPYGYYVYYIWANLATLNAFRRERGLSTLMFRAHADGGDGAEGGATSRNGLSQLAAAFLLADGVAHGVALARHPTLQYLYYLAQVPMTMSLLSTAGGGGGGGNGGSSMGGAGGTEVLSAAGGEQFVAGAPAGKSASGDGGAVGNGGGGGGGASGAEFLDNPFPNFFQRGLNVSLATHKPLVNHLTSEPLIEEYSVASKVWKLQNCDLCELARNSVRMSGFQAAWKRAALGPFFALDSVLGNAILQSRLADFRVAYRFEAYHAEAAFLDETLRTTSSATNATAATTTATSRSTRATASLSLGAVDDHHHLDQLERPRSMSFATTPMSLGPIHHSVTLTSEPSAPRLAIRRAMRRLEDEVAVVQSTTGAPVDAAIVCAAPKGSLIGELVAEPVKSAGSEGGEAEALSSNVRVAADDDVTPEQLKELEALLAAAQREAAALASENVALAAQARAARRAAAAAAAVAAGADAPLPLRIDGAIFGGVAA